MDAKQFLFDGFRLLPIPRELWRHEELLHVPRRCFDVLLYLIEHRDRAIGRDELVAAVWGRVDVTDSQVNQAILRARLAVADDGQLQRAIRTVPGFGYRWVLAVESSADAHAATNAAATASTSAVLTQSQAPATPVPAARRSRRPRLALAAVAALLVLAALTTRVWHPFAKPDAAPAVVPGRNVLAVLPFDVDAPRDSGWVRLGAMDLVADRLRANGLIVVPSDSVIAALHKVGEPLDGARRLELQRLLGADRIVDGTATKSNQGWHIEVGVDSAGHEGHRETARLAQMTDAARTSADLLSAALGHAAATVADEHVDLGEILQRSRAALLANELDTARTILADAPESLRAAPQVRAASARIDFRAGKPDQAGAALTALLADPAVLAQPALHAQILTTLGFIGIRREDCAAAEQQFAAALSALGNDASHEAGIALAARGLARACLHRFGEAVADLSRAGPLLEATGDRLARARVDNYFGVLEMSRDRPDSAVPYFHAAAALDESFGIVDATRANLSALCAAQTDLLRWSDALATSDRLRALQARTNDPALLFASAGLRAGVLIGLGRLHEADAELAETEAAHPDARGVVTRYLYAAKAELAWARQQPEVAMLQIGKALNLSPPSAQLASDEDHARAVLLLQRASIRVGQGAAASIPEPVASAAKVAAPLSPIYLVARAEWAAQGKDPARAEHEFRAALASADQQGIPAVIVTVADSYAAWALANGRLDDAKALAGRVAAWADGDFASALLQVSLFRATGQTEAWRRALHQAQTLAGERAIPDPLLRAP